MSIIINRGWTPDCVQGPAVQQESAIQQVRYVTVGASDGGREGHADAGFSSALAASVQADVHSMHQQPMQTRIRRAAAHA